MKRNSWAFIALAGLALVVLLVLLAKTFPGALDSREDRVALVYRLGLLALIGASVIAGWQGGASLALRQAIIWIGLFVAVLVIYTFREDFTAIGARVMGELVPARPVTHAPGLVSLRAGPDGHFRADALVNGTHVNFLVDTGATVVSLSPFDAQRIGFDLDALTFNRLISTANGRVLMAPVTLRSVTIGDITLENVRAVIASEGLDHSLLGMSFLSRLSSLQVDGDRLILRQ